MVTKEGSMVLFHSSPTILGIIGELGQLFTVPCDCAKKVSVQMSAQFLDVFPCLLLGASFPNSY